MAISMAIGFTCLGHGRLIILLINCLIKVILLTRMICQLQHC